MKKIIAVLLAMITLLTATAFAEGAPLVDVEMMDMTISVPEGMVYFIDETYPAVETFAAFYQDFDDTTIFNKNISFAYTNGCIDIYSKDPYTFASDSVADAVENFASIGIKAQQPIVVDADLDSQDGREALFMSFYTYVDYSALGYNIAANQFSVQMIMPYVEKDITYVVTITTDNPEDSELLFRIADSIRWN